MFISKEISPLTMLLVVGGTSVRLAYGVVSLLQPAKMVEAELAPDTHGLPDPQLLLRAFGGHQLLIGSFALVALRRGRSIRSAVTLSLAIDALDVASALLEWRDRGEADQSVRGGIVLSGVGLLTFAAARRALAR